MHVPALGYRSLFLMAVVTAMVSAVVNMVYARKIQDARREADQMTPAAISFAKLRDREFDFTVENYGYMYKGRTGEVIDDFVLTFGAWEKFMLFFLDDYTRAAGLEQTAFIDVGANTGQHSLFMAPRVKEVHAIEPFPPVLKRLYANIALNKFTNVWVHEVGFAEKEGAIPFFVPDEHNMGEGSFRVGDKGKKWSDNLRIVAGDEYFRTVSTAPSVPVGIIKMDVEGYEEPALQGLRQTMGTHRPLVIVEVTTANHSLGGSIGSFAQLRGLFPANYEFLMFEQTARQAFDGNYDVRDFAPVAGQFFKTGQQKNLIAVPVEKLPVVPRHHRVEEPS
jgi:FkbM family methyltransferase